MTDVLHIQQESPRTRVLLIAVAVLREVPATIDGWVTEDRWVPVTVSSLFLDEDSLLLELVIGTLDDEEGIDNADVADPHARLTILSHLFVAEILDKEGWTFEVNKSVFGKLIVLEVEAIKDPGIGLSPVTDDETVTGLFGILAWLLDIRKWRISANARCRPPAIRSLLDLVLECWDSECDLGLSATKIEKC